MSESGSIAGPPAFMPRDKWVAREMEAIHHLQEVRIDMSLEGQIARCWSPSCTAHTLYTPEGPGRVDLLRAYLKAGIDVLHGDPERANCPGEEVPLRAGVFTYDVADLLRWREEGHKPFNRTYMMSDEWCRAQGGFGHAPVEYGMYAVLRYVLAGRSLPSEAVWFAGCNCCGPGRVLRFKLDPDRGASIDGLNILYQYSERVAVPWIFSPLPSAA